MVLVLSISFDRVFQLTRSRGAWLNFLTMKCISPKFQLTRSRGAWREDFDFTLNKLNFNSHAHVERDMQRRYGENCRGKFQLTRSRGAWQFVNSTKALEMNFNSHAHVERGWDKLQKHNVSIIFQLTRSRGAWPPRRSGAVKIIKFLCLLI